MVLFKNGICLFEANCVLSCPAFDFSTCCFRMLFDFCLVTLFFLAPFWLLPYRFYFLASLFLAIIFYGVYLVGTIVVHSLVSALLLLFTSIWVSPWCCLPFVSIPLYFVVYETVDCYTGDIWNGFSFCSCCSCLCNITMMFPLFLFLSLC